MCSLKEASRIACCLRSQPTVTEILLQLLLFYGTVSSFDILMQALYQVALGIVEEVTAYAIRLEEAMAKTRTNCLERNSKTDAQQKPKDNLFNGVHNGIQDSMQY